VVFVDNVPTAAGGDGELDDLLREVIDRAGSRAANRAVEGGQ